MIHPSPSYIKVSINYGFLTILPLFFPCNILCDILAGFGINSYILQFRPYHTFFVCLINPFLFLFILLVLLRPIFTQLPIPRQPPICSLYWLTCVYTLLSICYLNSNSATMALNNDHEKFLLIGQISLL